MWLALRSKVAYLEARHKAIYLKIEFRIEDLRFP